MSEKKPTRPQIQTTDLPDLEGEVVIRDYMWRGRTRITYSRGERDGAWSIRGNGTLCGRGGTLARALTEAAENFNALAAYWLAEAVGNVDREIKTKEH